MCCSIAKSDIERLKAKHIRLKNKTLYYKQITTFNNKFAEEVSSKTN